MNNQFRKVKRYLELLNENRWQRVEAATDLSVCPCDYKSGNTPPPLAEFVPFEYGSVWGQGRDSHAWFHCTCPQTTPELFLRVQTELSGWDATNPQFIVYVNGEMKQGLDTNHREVHIGDVPSADVYIYAYTAPGLEHAQLFVDFCTLSSEVDGLYYDMLYPFQMLSYLNADSAEYAQLLYFLYRAASILELYDIASPEFFESVRRARKYLKEELYEEYCGPRTSVGVCIGHTHIDCAWKWTLRQSREKVQRSFSTVLELMRRYPEYKFMSSQALLYKMLKEEAPEVYERVREKIREGRWECEGAMWVEADCNLSSGESLIRQVLYGKRFFHQEFGVDCRVLWLPDVFGYSAALPQILRKCGVDWFLTSKISWNDTNQLPYDTFLWEGLDGTKINSYFLTACDAKGSGPDKKGRTTYNAQITAQQVKGTYERYHPKHLSNETLITFGFGDGGGGPTSENLELARRGACGIPGSPQVKIDFAGDFLKRLEKKIENHPDLPTWQGELYLEFHRGTYTTMAKNKRNNRKSEFLYEDAECLSTMAKALFGDVYPKSELLGGWESILTNQFHDIIPGSSIKEVYDQSDIDYEEIRTIGSRIADGVRQKIAASVSEKEGYVVFNPHSFTADGMVSVNGETVMVKNIPSKGYTVVSDFVSENRVEIRMDERTAENSVLRVAFDEAWQITSIFDKRKNREVLQEGRVGNEIRIFADYPDRYDAWEWNAYSLGKYRTLRDVQSAEAVNDGVRRGIRLVRKYGSSTVTQTVWFTDDSARIDFDTLVDWHERHQMVKAVFPVDIHTDKATFDIQFGSLERPTHFNTSWEQAKFEVCGHKYADLSEGGYGVALLNDCKYGYDIHNGIMALSLLRSPTDPNPEADQGEMRCVYSLYPHCGTLAESDTVREAYLLNNPMTILPASGRSNAVPLSYSVLEIDSDHVICETVKEEEDGEGTILRLYEYKNMRDHVSLQLGMDVKEAYLCDMMENELCELGICDGRIEVDIKGFEILTIKVK